MTNLIVLSLAINFSGHVFAGIGWPGGILRSTDNGGNWTTVYSGSTSLYVPSLAINARGHIFAGLHATYPIDGGILRSTDNGDSWTEVYTSSAIGFNCLAINASGHVFAGTSRDGIFRSTDNGDSWTSVNTGLTDLYVGSLAINASGHIFAATGDGVFRSIDNGDSWTAVNTGLTNLSVQSLAVAPSRHIFAGTSGGGVFRSVLSTTAVSENDSEMPSSFLLEQNYPNPFNASTTIEFALPKSAFCTLKFFNLLGEEVVTLVSEKQSAGYHSVVWDAAGFSSGIYFCRMESGEFVKVVKLLLVQ